MKYVAQLDGLRAIAILSVMVFHLGFFPLGWIGVPLFFVLSGYLITTILVADRGNSLKEFLARFYWRRTVRIFPLYYLYLFVIATAAYLFGYSLEGYGWFLVYLGNYQIALSQDAPAGGLVAHLWSLAVEEQFYLVWPFVVFFSRRVWPWALVGIVVAPIFREVIIQSTGNSATAIVALPGCLDLLAAGALVAVVKDYRGMIAMASIGATIVTWSIISVPYESFAEPALWVPQSHLFYTGLALIFGPLMLLAPKIRLLGWEPLVWVGRVSYGLYIWHLLAFAAARRLPWPEWSVNLVGIAVAFMAATVSWYLFERPLLALKDIYKGPSKSTGS